MKNILVLGAGGGFGKEMARVFLERGYTVSALVRKSSKSKLDPRILLIEGDSMNNEDVLKASSGADVIVHGVNPSGYKNWRELALPMLKNTIDAAKQNNCLIAFPGNIYNFDAYKNEKIDELTPQSPISVKGQVRLEMEHLLRKSGARVIVLRGGDYIGKNLKSSWFSRILRVDHRGQIFFTYPGDIALKHSWAYLPDFAQAFFKLIEKRDQLQPYEEFMFRGLYFSGEDLRNHLFKKYGEENVKIKSVPWAIINILALCVTLFKELKEMRYLWKTQIILDDGKLQKILGDVHYSDLSQVIEESL